MNKSIDMAIIEGIKRLDGEAVVKFDGPWDVWTTKDGKSHYASRSDLIEELHIDATIYAV